MGHVTRAGECWPYVTGLLVKPPAPGPSGSGSLSAWARAQGSEGCSQLEPLLSIRLSEGLSRATKSSPRAFFSVEGGMLPTLRRVSESAWAEAARLPEQAWRDN